MLSTTQMTPYGLMKALTEIGDDTSKAIEKNVPKEGKPKTGESRGIKPQDKTGSYGEKRKPVTIVTGKQIGRAHV